MMHLIEWREDFAIGIAEVDSEHRALIDGINALHARLTAEAPASEVCAALGGIHSDIAAHFALEEKNMIALGYDGYEAHKVEHERLLDDILDIVEDVYSSDRYDREVLAGRLSEWFGHHFRTQDAMLHRWLQRGA